MRSHSKKIWRVTAISGLTVLAASLLAQSGSSLIIAGQPVRQRSSRFLGATMSPLTT